MMTGNEYKESLRKIHPRIYYMGEKIDWASQNYEKFRHGVLQIP